MSGGSLLSPRGSPTAPGVCLATVSCLGFMGSKTTPFLPAETGSGPLWRGSLLGARVVLPGIPAAQLVWVRTGWRLPAPSAGLPTDRAGRTLCRVRSQRKNAAESAFVPRHIGRIFVLRCGVFYYVFSLLSFSLSFISLLLSLPLSLSLCPFPGSPELGNSPSVFGLRLRVVSESSR